MRLRNKKTGEIAELGYIASSGGQDVNTNEFICKYGSLAEINAEWEDYDPPKRTWFIDMYCMPDYINYGNNPITDHCYDTWNELGFCFETKEEAELAVQKLKAYKRLKDKGFRFCGHDDRDRGQLGDIVIYAEMPTFEYDDDSTGDDLDLLFSGGEE